MKLEEISNWDNENEKLLIKPLYDSIKNAIELNNQKPIYRLCLADGSKIIVTYKFSFNDANISSALYYKRESECPENVRKQGFENYYCFVFTIDKIEKLNKEKPWLSEGKNIGISYHDWPIEFEQLKNRRSTAKSK
jgi:hypothetical protein